jgi:HAE1 family hydrophobic/amphiphilic exporter-1
MLVLYLFLGSMISTLIISLAIPFSIVATFLPMQVAGVSLNVMSLGGLALGVGMLVDNSIVVLESIFRQAERGANARDAAARGTQRVAGAVTASTLTTVAVFMPIAFVEGVAGQLFSDQALTVVASLLASLVVSLLFIPMLAARRLPDAQATYSLVAAWRSWASWRSFRVDLRGVGRSWIAWALRICVAIPLFPVACVLELLAKLIALASFVAVCLVGLLLRLLDRLITVAGWLPRKAVVTALAAGDRFYPALLRGLITQPLPLIVILGLAAVVSWWLARDLGSELMPEVVQGELLVHLELPVGTPLEQTDEVVARLERQLSQSKALAGILGSFDARVGVARTATSDPGAGEHSALLRLRVQGTGALQERERRLIEVIQQFVSEIPELSVRFARPTLLSLATPLVVEVASEDLDALARGARQVVALLAAEPGVSDVRSSVRAGSPEFHIAYDRNRLAAFSLDIKDVAEQVRRKVHGERATRVSWEGEKIDLWVALDREDVRSLEALGRLRIDAGDEQAIPKRLEEVASMTRAHGPAEIRHAGQQRVAVIEGRVAGFDLGRTATRLAAKLAELEAANGDLADAPRFRIAGQSAEMSASLGSLAFALTLALFLVYVVMASQFESVVQPLLIMLTVPLAAVGVIATLWFAGLALSVLVLIGGIVLAGVAVNNAIVLVDAINQEFEQIGGAAAGRQALVDAIIEGSRTRLRPVLMTTLTTVLGLLPMTGMLGQTSGIELRQPLALTIIAGLVSSTALTLLVTPVFYGLFAGWGLANREPVAASAT